MKANVIGFTGFLITTLMCGQAGAYVHASGNRSSWSASDSRGGTASGGDGSWSGTGAHGGTASGGDGSWSGKSAYGGTASGGDGSWHANGADGGTASGGDGSWHATGADGTTAYGGANNEYYGGAYDTYHPPVTVNTTYEEGCDDCGGWSTAGAAAVGLAAGVAVGAAVASDNAAAVNATNTTNAYDAGVAAGVAESSTATVGAIYTSLPPAGCVPSTHDNTQLFNCGGVWFMPSYGANGVFYRVVPAP